MAITINEPHDLRALVAMMRSAKAQRVGMAIWDRDIEAIENTISIIAAMRRMPRRDDEAAQRLAEWAGKLGPARS